MRGPMSHARRRCCEEDVETTFAEALTSSSAHALLKPSNSEFLDVRTVGHDHGSALGRLSSCFSAIMLFPWSSAR